MKGKNKVQQQKQSLSDKQPAHRSIQAPVSVWQGWLSPLQTARYKAEQGLFCAVDPVALQQQLDRLAEQEQTKDGFRMALLAVLKETYSAARLSLKNRLFAERDGADYVGAHAHVLDVIINTALFAASHHVYSCPPDFAVMAVGGYGRGELAPHSDIDLLFVMPDRTGAKTEQMIEFLLYLLWDMGLSVGHASRSVKENLHAADKDATICTALLEMRPICGSQPLARHMASAFTKWLKREPALPFVGAKLEERAQRHKRTGGTRYAVEPNVKDGKGGLRDLHTLFWIAKYAYRARDISQVLETGLLRPSEARSFAAAQRFLWTVRCFLHLHQGREDDRLSFDAQMNIAPRMRFSDRAGMRGVERFMKRYYLAARQVGNLTRIFCAALESDFDSRPRISLKKLWFAGADRHLNITPFRLENERMHLPENLRFRDNRDLMVRLFHLAHEHELDIHPDSLRRLTRAVRAAKTAQLQTPAARQCFLDILTHKNNPERVLRLMNESGWLGTYLPDFGRIAGMMQFDMYHSYTVDEHTLKAVGIMHDIENGLLRDIAPMASQLIHEIFSRRALFVAIFLHDIAKGRGGDHSVLGAGVARVVCPLLGLDDGETQTVVWLIEQHLLMSRIAFRYDLNDPQTIVDFAAEVQSPERLKLLLILTVADIQAVGPDVWNGWKASLMRDLYRRTEAVLGGAAPSEVSLGAASDALDAARAALQDWDDDRFDAYARLFYPSYWTNFNTASHIYHASLAERFAEGKQQLLIDFKVDEDKKSTILVVMAADHPGLFSRIVGSVAMAGCSIVNARINTRHDGTILDQFRIQDSRRQAVTEKQTQTRIARMIEQSLAGDISLFDRLQEKSSQLSARIKAMKVPPAVFVTNGRSKTHTVIEVNGADRPGLLYQITYHLVQLGLQVNSASVSTYGEKAVDVFYVKDVYGLQIEKEATQEKIRNTLMAIFEREDSLAAQTGGDRLR